MQLIKKYHFQDWLSAFKQPEILHLSLACWLKKCDKLKANFGTYVSIFWALYNIFNLRFVSQF
jgi:hypothetical protein